MKFGGVVYSGSACLVRCVLMFRDPPSWTDIKSANSACLAMLAAWVAVLFLADDILHNPIVENGNPDPINAESVLNNRVAYRHSDASGRIYSLPGLISC